MSKRLWPRARKEKDKSGRRWCIIYDLAYDGGGGSFKEYYRTRRGARIAAWWNVHFASWGGTADLYDQTVETPPPFWWEKTPKKTLSELIHDFLDPKKFQERRREALLNTINRINKEKN